MFSKDDRKKKNNYLKKTEGGSRWKDLDHNVSLNRIETKVIQNYYEEKKTTQ